MNEKEEKQTWKGEGDKIERIDLNLFVLKCVGN
jgi:hypothetical protein